VHFVLAPKSETIKIGRSTDPDKRLRSLQTGNSEPVEIVLLLPHLPPFEEGQLHWRFRKYRTPGEWFEYRGELRAFVERKRKNPSATPADDRALGESEEGKNDGYHYPKNDNKLEINPQNPDHPADDSRPSMMSPAYGVRPSWGDAHEAWEFWENV
jgi:hypothetical protein